jgi:pimeloyl-ACP methyl ester carboxylesterase
MPHAVSRDKQIYYEPHGANTSTLPILLVAGQGAQLISWHPDFVSALVNAGFQVITYDNRDVGLSTKFDSAPNYTLTDMADDAASLLDWLELAKVHVVGQSMGGMIAQQLAISHPSRVASLCSIYSSPSPRFITKDTNVWDVRDETPATDREGAIQQYIEQERIAGLDEFSEEWIRSYAEATIDRCYYPEGKFRQMAALRRSGDRTDLLTDLKVPAAVLHGLEDRLIGIAGGLATADAIPGAELHIYADMGHQLLPSLFSDYVRVIARTARRADAMGTTR